mgnify:CR=1 FL=1
MRAACAIACGMRGIMRLLVASMVRAVHRACMLCLLPYKRNAETGVPIFPPAARRVYSPVDSVKSVVASGFAA